MMYVRRILNSVLGLPEMQDSRIHVGMAAFSLASCSAMFLK